MLVPVLVEWILPALDCMACRIERVIGQPRPTPDLEMQTVSHEVKSVPARHGDTQYCQRTGQIIIVCVSYSIPLSNTLSQRPFPIFTGHRRSDTLSRTTAEARNQWQTHILIQHFLLLLSACSLSVSTLHKIAI